MGKKAISVEYDFTYISALLQNNFILATFSAEPHSCFQGKAFFGLQKDE